MRIIDWSSDVCSADLSVFVNKIDKAHNSLEALTETLTPLSGAALVAREMPISKGEEIVGFIDLALDRAFRFRPGQPSEPVALPPELAEAEHSPNRPRVLVGKGV